MPLIDFSRDDLELLRQLRPLLEHFRRLPQNALPQRPSDLHNFSPEVYVAGVPEAGIPAMSAVGTAGTAGGNDTPGSALCDIFKITGTAPSEELTPYLFQKKIYNVGVKAIAQATTPYILVHRTKSGKWLTGVGSTAASNQAGVYLTESAITAASGTALARTLGSGTVTSCRRSGTGLIAVQTGLTVYNSTTQTEVADMIIQVKQDGYGDLWWDVADCP